MVPGSWFTLDWYLVHRWISCLATASSLLTSFPFLFPTVIDSENLTLGRSSFSIWSQQKAIQQPQGGLMGALGAHSSSSRYRRRCVRPTLGTLADTRLPEPCRLGKINHFGGELLTEGKLSRSSVPDPWMRHREQTPCGVRIFFHTLTCVWPPHSYPLLLWVDRPLELHCRVCTDWAQGREGPAPSRQCHWRRTQPPCAQAVPRNWISPEAASQAPKKLPTPSPSSWHTDPSSGCILLVPPPPAWKLHPLGVWHFHQ